MSQIKRILVTGGAGFLGSHLCERLVVSDGHDVICLDNFFTSQKSNVLHLHRQAELRAHPARRHAPALARGGRDLQHGLPRGAGPLPVQPDQDDEDVGHGRDQRARHGQSAATPKSCKPRPARSTATRTSTRSPRATGATSTRSAPARATTRASGPPRRCSLTITG